MKDREEQLKYSKVQHISEELTEQSRRALPENLQNDKELGVVVSGAVLLAIASKFKIMEPDIGGVGFNRLFIQFIHPMVCAVRNMDAETLQNLGWEEKEITPIDMLVYILAMILDSKIKLVDADELGSEEEVAEFVKMLARVESNGSIH